MPDDADERPEGDALAVGEAAAAQHEPVFADARHELLDESRLADARVGEQGHEAAAALLDGGPECGLDRRQLLPATDERSLVPPQKRLGAGQHVEEVERAYRPLLALHLERLDLLDVHARSDEPPGLLAEEDLPGRGVLLEARRRVGGVAGHEVLRAGHAHARDLTGVDAHAAGESQPPLPLELVVQVVQPRLHLQGGAARTKGVVFVEDGDTEDGHDRVADEPGHRAAVALDDRPHRVVVGGEHRRQLLRAESLRQPRTVDQVAEQQGDHLPKAPVGPDRKLVAAGDAETGAGGVFLAAHGARFHRGSMRVNLERPSQRRQEL